MTIKENQKEKITYINLSRCIATKIEKNNDVFFKTGINNFMTNLILKTDKNGKEIYFSRYSGESRMMRISKSDAFILIKEGIKVYNHNPFN